MNQLQMAYKVAQTQLGTKEISGHANNPKVVEYHQSCTLQASNDEVPWCSAFVNWCYLIAGILIDPGNMEKLLHSKAYQQNDIDLFFKSAILIAQKLGVPVDPILKKTIVGINVHVGTRSAAARSWLSFGARTRTPQRGDVVVFERGNDGWSGHVAFFEDSTMTTVKHLGGNQGNAVTESTSLKVRVLGYMTESV